MPDTVLNTENSAVTKQNKIQSLLSSSLYYELGEKPQKSPGILTKIQSVLRTSPWGAGSGRGFRKSSGGSSRDLGEGVKMGWRQGSR